jgi:hypothetical protein
MAGSLAGGDLVATPHRVARLQQFVEETPSAATRGLLGYAARDQVAGCHP